jgi:hypothetical protein
MSHLVLDDESDARPTQDGMMMGAGWLSSFGGPTHHGN